MVDEYEKVSLSEKQADKKAGIIHNIQLKLVILSVFSILNDLQIQLKSVLGIEDL